MKKCIYIFVTLFLLFQESARATNCLSRTAEDLLPYNVVDGPDNLDPMIANSTPETRQVMADLLIRTNELSSEQKSMWLKVLALGKRLKFDEDEDSLRMARLFGNQIQVRPDAHNSAKKFKFVGLKTQFEMIRYRLAANDRPDDEWNYVFINLQKRKTTLPPKSSDFADMASYRAAKNSFYNFNFEDGTSTRSLAKTLYGVMTGLSAHLVGMNRKRVPRWFSIDVRVPHHGTNSEINEFRNFLTQFGFKSVGGDTEFDVLRIRLRTPTS